MTLSELIERVEKMEGPDREVDCAIAVTIGGFVAEYRKWRDEPDYIDMRHGVANYPGHGGDQLVPEYTASLDAAIALTERVLPGWFWRAGRTSLFPRGWAYVSRTHPSHCDRNDEASSSDGKAASPAIALLLATLRALSAQERDDGR